MLKDKCIAGNMSLHNRVVAAPVVSNSADEDGLPTPRSLEIYRGYAESGAGMTVVEQHAVHPWGRNKLNQFRLYDDASALALEPLTALFRQRDIPVVAQLNFAGAGASSETLLACQDFKLVSPSGLRTPRDLIKHDSQALQHDEITSIVQAFADAAGRAVTLAKYSGGVQIYACHGYLIGQFLSPMTNRRSDAYGGALENRARLLFEIVEAVKAVIGGHPLSVRLGAADQMPGAPEVGLTLADSVWVAEQLAKMRVDWLSVSGNHCIYGIGADDNDTAYFAPYSKAIRDSVAKYGVLVDCTGGIRTAQRAQALLNSEICDLVGVARPLIKDKTFLFSWDL